jgi:hypothetical protein
MPCRIVFEISVLRSKSNALKATNYQETAIEDGGAECPTTLANQSAHCLNVKVPGQTAKTPSIPYAQCHRLTQFGAAAAAALCTSSADHRRRSLQHTCGAGRSRADVMTGPKQGQSGKLFRARVSMSAEFLTRR